MWWQNASARTVATTSPALVALPVQVEQRADRGRPRPPPAERREVLLAQQQRRRLVHPVEVERRGPRLSTWPRVERVDRLGAVRDPVGVAPPHRGEPRVEALGRRRLIRRIRTSGSSTPLSRRQSGDGSGRWLRHRGRAPARPSVEVDVRHLRHARARRCRCVRPRSARSPWTRSTVSRALLEVALHGAQGGLPGPAVEGGPVVGEVESQSHRVNLSGPQPQAVRGPPPDR